MQNKELQMFISAAFAGLLYYLGIVAVPIIVEYGANSKSTPMWDISEF